MYECLLRWHLDYYIDNDPERYARGKAPRLHHSPKAGRGWSLTANERKRILLASIFGVDIDPQAVEVTKLSLLLKVLEGESSESVAAQIRLFHERALPDLGKNIRCGNSLVGTDLLRRLEAVTLSGDDVLRINPFDWEKDFPAVFDASRGGFDVVVGNPPYAYRKATEKGLRTYYLDRYVTAEGNFELYKFFIERAVTLLRPGGTLGYIVSATFLIQPSFEKLRRLLLRATTLQEIAGLGPGVFQDATVDTAIVVTKKKTPRTDHRVAVLVPRTFHELERTNPHAALQRRWARNPGHVIDYRLTERGAALFDRLAATHGTVEDHYDFGVGINTGFIRDELVANRRLDARYHRMVPGKGISRYGPVKTDGWIMYDPEFVRSKGALGRTLPEERFLASEKVLVVRTRNLGLERRIVATLDRTGAYNLNRLSNIITQAGASLSTLLGVLNSELFQWLFSTRYWDYEIKPFYLRSSPFPGAPDATIGTLVEDMLGLTVKLRSARTDLEAATLRKRLVATEARIDDAVYANYGVSAAERGGVSAELASLWRPTGAAAPDGIGDDGDAEDDE